ncbi:MAG: FG-GAP-like repeat-containing protein [Acidobacteria bacterium]|jgi:hypothetical protein|nr:FG-GAP-like repeat-containing protein [Acidobacteriota bacterium]
MVFREALVRSLLPWFLVLSCLCAAPALCQEPSATTDYEGGPILTLDAEIYRVTESTKTVAVRILRGGSKTEAVSVRLRTVDGSARAGSDYTGVDFVVKLPKGKTQKKLKLKIARDSTPETSETFLLVLSEPSAGASLGTPRLGTVVIAGDRPDPPLAASAGGDARVTLGETAILAGSASGALGPVRFNWTLASKPAGSAVTLPAPTEATQRVSPDLAGSYVLSLVVSDPARSSAPARVTLTADALPEPEPVVVGVDEVRFTRSFRSEVDPVSEILVGFLGPVDPATLNDQTVRLTRDGVPVPCTRAFDAELVLLTLTPDAPLQFDSFYQLDVSGIGSTQRPFSFSGFTTVFQTPKQPFGLVAGQVVGAKREPLEFVTVRCAGQVQLTDASGRFFFENVPPGRQDLFIDTDTIVSDVIYTPMHYLVDVQGGALPTTIGGPIILTIVDRTGAVEIPGSVVLHNPNIPGLSIDWTGVVPRQPTGALFTGEVTLSSVIPTDVPMPFPGPGSFYWTVQPGGLLLDPPAKITVPLPVRMSPGRQVDLWSFDHATNEWVNYAQATVNPDGVTATSNPGQGLPFTGWGAVVTRTEVVRDIGGSGGKAISGRVFDAADNPLHGVAVTSTGGESVYTDYVVENERVVFDGSLDGSYRFSQQLVGFNEEINGTFSEFVPVPVQVRAFARDLAGNVYNATEIIDISAIADPTVPDGGLPDELPGPTLRLTDYSVERDGKLLLHEDGIRDDLSHVIRHGNVLLVNSSTRYKQEIEALSRRLAALGFRENDAGEFLRPTETYARGEPIHDAVRVFQAIWFGGGYGPRFQTASGEVTAEVLEALNTPRGVIWSTNGPFVASNGYEYVLVNRNDWFHATIPFKLQQLTARTGLNCGTRATGGPRCLEGRCSAGDNHQAGGAVDMNMVSTSGTIFPGSFYRCLKGTFDTSSRECTLSVSVSPQGVPEPFEEWTEADRASNLPTVDDAIAAGRTWQIKTGYSRTQTQAHIDQIRNLTGAAAVIFNDPAITGVSRVAAHHHHIHVNWLYRHGDEHPAGTEGAPPFPSAPLPEPRASGFRVVDYEPNEIDAAVPPNARFFLEFSEPVDPATLTEETVRLVELNTGERVPLARVLNAAGTRLELVPAGELPERAIFVLRVSAALQSASGEPLDLGPFGNEDLSSFFTGLSPSVVSAEFGSESVTLTRFDLSGIALSVQGRNASGASRAIDQFVADFLLEGASSLVLDGPVGPDGRLLRTFNGRSVLTALLDGPLAPSVPVTAEIVAGPRVAPRVRVGQPVVAEFGEPLDTPTLSLVTAAVQALDGASIDGTAALLPDRRTVSFTPANLPPAGRPLFLLVTLRVTDPAGRGIDLITASPFLFVGQVPDELDSDGDGLSDNLERALSPCVAPNVPDTDLDGTPDRDEDCDGDGLTNLDELGRDLDPGDNDSDDDGAPDGLELRTGCDPLVRQTATLTGRTVDPTGAPVAGADIAPLFGTGTASSASDGRFSLAGAAACVGNAVLATGSVGPKLTRGLSARLQLAAGEVRELGDITLREVSDLLYPNPVMPRGGRGGIDSGVQFDVDRDGTIDVITSGSGTVDVWRGNGEGRFGPPVGFGAGSSPTGIELADFTHDGTPDVVVANDTNTGSVSFLRGLEEGRFGTSIQSLPPTISFPERLTSGDFDQDGTRDVAVADGRSSTIRILQGNGAGAFTEISAPAITAFRPRDVVSGDVTGDGTLDLLVARQDITGGFDVLRGIGNGTFASPEPVAAGLLFDSLFVADLDGDTDLDVLSVERNRNLVTIRGNGNGTFAPAESQPSRTTRAKDLALVDLDQDGTQDVVVAGDAQVEVFFGRGSGSYAPSEEYIIGCQPEAVFPHDADRDGLIDLVVGDDNLGSLIVNRGTTLGAWERVERIPLSDFVPEVDTADFNGDGTADVAGVVEDDVDVAIALGRGDGTFQPPLTVPFDGNARDVDFTLSDLDGDGDVDIVIAEADFDRVSFSLNDGRANFGTPVTLPTGDGPVDVDAADVTGDGVIDLLTANESAFTISLLRGDGAGSFAGAVAISTGIRPRQLAVGDLDGDGTADLAVSTRDALELLFGTGDGAFDRRTSVTEVADFNDLRIVDLDRDGIVDLLGASYRFGFAWLRGRGDGTFDAAVRPPGGGVMSSATTSDVDLDGRLDIVGTDDSLGMVIFRQAADGSFGPFETYDVDCFSESLVLGDFNRDGLPDVVAGTAFGSFHVILHR